MILSLALSITVGQLSFGALLLISHWRSKSTMTQIYLRKGEPVEKALRRLKRILAREGVLQEVRDHRYYEKPSVKNRKKTKAARFTQMLRERYADL
jgi:small subunit ribosomal protein S21